MKIAIYSGEIPSTTFIERLITGIASSNHTVYLFGVKKRDLSYPAKVICTGYKQNRIYKAYYWFKYALLLILFKNSQKKQLDAYLKNEGKDNVYTKMKCYPVLWYQPDVFHVQWAKSISEWMWVQDFGIKLILSLRGAHVNYSPLADTQLAATYRNCFPKVDGFHAVSKAIALEAQNYGANPKLMHVVYSGLKETTFSHTKLPSETLRLISVGRNHWKKGYAYALKCCNILKAHHVNFTYTIIGASGSEELEFLRQEYELQEEVTFTTAKSFKDVQHFIANADVFVLPSIEEGIANVVLEAMQLGTLVISTDCGGMNEVIINGENGFCVPIRNPQKMAEAVMHVMQLSGVEKEAIILKAKNTIAIQHNEKAMVNGMMALYSQVCHPEPKRGTIKTDK